VVSTTGPRYFGFVTGGALPATVAAGGLPTILGQKPGLVVVSPPGSGGEGVAGAGRLRLLGLARGAGGGVVPRASHGDLHGAGGRAPRAAAARGLGRRRRRAAGRAEAARDCRR